MHLPSILGLALRRLGRRPIRSFLLLQGTVWGVAVAVFPGAVIEGTREAARTRGALLGADRISVAADPTAGTVSPLERADLDALRKALDRAGIQPLALGGASVQAPLAGGADDAKEAPAALVASTPQVPRARGLVLAAGRWLRPDDPPGACLVEGEVAAWLGRPSIEVGDRVTLPGRGGALRVVGVLAPRSETLRRADDLGFDVGHPLYRGLGRGMLLMLGIPLVEDAWKRSDRAVYVPLQGGALDWIFLRVDTREVKRAADVVSSTLVARGRAPVTLHPLVLPFVLGGQIDRFEAVRTALFLACLVMGGVVMANIGLLASLERSTEIAIRRVEGATRADVALHFLLEGQVLAAVGSVLGCFLGMGLAALRVAFEPVTGFAWVFPWSQAGIAVGVALGIGVLASLLPALDAVRRPPAAVLADE